MTHKEWEKLIRHKLIDMGLTQSEVAKELGISRQYVSQTINGNLRAESANKLLSDYFGIEMYEND